jgi:hypothetical protein
MHGNSSISASGFVDQFLKICWKISVEILAFTRDRMNESELFGMQRLALEAQPVEHGFERFRSAPIDWIAQ